MSADKITTAKLAALRARLDQGGNLNPETLSQSYGLPLTLVEAEVRDHGGPYGKKS